MVKKSSVVTGIRKRSPGNARKKLLALTQMPALSISTTAGPSHIPAAAAPKMLRRNSATFMTINAATNAFVLFGSGSLSNRIADVMPSAATITTAKTTRASASKPGSRINSSR